MPPSSHNGHAAPLSDREKLARFEELVHNVVTSRSQFWQNLLDRRRDLEGECGYPQSGFIPAQNFQDLYDREAISARVVEVLPRESWQVQPLVYEVEDSERITDFEEAWDELGKQLRGERCYYQDEAGSPVWEYLLRADILSGIGSYGVILLGLDDGQDLRESADFVPLRKAGSNGNGSGSNKRKRVAKLLYLRCFPESLAQITRYESDLSSPRYGQPVEYLLTFNDPRETTQGGIGMTTASVNVHWTRVIHVADNLSSSEVFGVPRMRPVLNRLLDLRKLHASSAEMYWRGAFPGISIETHPQLGGDVEVDRERLVGMIEDYSNSLQRYLALFGFSAKMLSPTVVDPTTQIKVQIEAICIQLGIPNRVFMGSERGELASSQDDAAWNDRLKHRQQFYLTPRVIVPFVDRLIALGVLPQPQGYSVEWPDLTSTSEIERVTAATQKTAALAQYVGGGLEALMVPMDFLTRVLGFNEEEAESILDNASEAEEERLEEEEEQAPQPPQPPGAPPPGGGGGSADGQAPPTPSVPTPAPPSSPAAPAVPVPTGNVTPYHVQLEQWLDVLEHPAMRRRGEPARKRWQTVAVANYRPGQPRGSDGKFGSGGGGGGGAGGTAAGTSSGASAEEAGSKGFKQRAAAARAADLAIGSIKAIESVNPQGEIVKIGEIITAKPAAAIRTMEEKRNLIVKTVSDTYTSTRDQMLEAGVPSAVAHTVAAVATAAWVVKPSMIAGVALTLAGVPAGPALMSSSLPTGTLEVLGMKQVAKLGGKVAKVVRRVRDNYRLRKRHRKRQAGIERVKKSGVAEKVFGNPGGTTTATPS